MAKLFSMDPIFPNFPLRFSRNFRDSEIHQPGTKNSHMSNNWYKIYMCKALICRTSAMNTVIVVFHLYMVTTCIYTHAHSPNVGSVHKYRRAGFLRGVLVFAFFTRQNNLVKIRTN